MKSYCNKTSIKKIEYYDSLHYEGASVIKNIKRFIKNYNNNNNKQILDVNKWITLSNKLIPKQTNGYDCGVHLLKIAKSFILMESINYNEREITSFRYNKN